MSAAGTKRRDAGAVTTVAVALALVLCLCLAGCTSGAPGWSIEERTTLADLRERYPEARNVLDPAAQTPIEHDDDGWVIARRPGLSVAGSRWRPLSRGIQVTVSPNEPGSYQVSVLGTGEHIVVRRLGCDAATGIVETRDRLVIARTQGADAFFFSTELGVEELVLLHDATETMAYELELPSGWSLRRAQGHRPIVEVLDARGVPWARMVAERAWDGLGREIELRIAVDGATVELELPAQAHGPVLVDPEWHDAGTLSDGRLWATATLLPNGHVLVAGGVNANATGLYANPTVDRFDPATETFSPTDSMTVPRLVHTATLLPTGQVLLAGGLEQFGGLMTRTAELYDAAAGAFRATGSMNDPRTAHTATLLADGRVMLVGGYSRAVVTASAEVFDPASESFSVLEGLEVARAYHTATLLPSGEVLVVGGHGSLGEAVASAEIFDPALQAFAPTGQLGVARYDAPAILLAESGPVLIAGGYQPPSTTFLESVELYDIASGAFASGDDLPMEMAAAAASLLPDGDALLMGGIGGGAARYDVSAGTFSSAELLPTTRRCDTPVVTSLARHRLLVICPEEAFVSDLAAPSFEQPEPASMAAPRAEHTATLLADGTVLVIGGGASEAEIYDADADLFTVVAGLPVPERRAHTATVLSSGEVLAVGGLAGGESLSSAVLFDGQGQEFSSTDGPLATARHDHRATLLPDGTVLVTGGRRESAGGACETLASAELFDPVAKRFSSVGSLLTARWGHTATLLANGQVLVMGGRGSCDSSFSLASAELYEPSTGQFSEVAAAVPAGFAEHAAIAIPDGTVLLLGPHGFGPMVFDVDTGRFTRVELGAPAKVHYRSTATLLPNGDVLSAGGLMKFDPLQQFGVTPAARRFDTAAQDFRETLSMTVARERHTATLLADGQVLLLGGYTSEGEDATATAELWRADEDVVEEWRPVVTSVPSSATPGSLVSFEGTGLRGVSEGNGGNQNSPTNAPIAVWMPLEGAPSYGTIVDWTDTTATWKVPGTSYPGPGLLFVVVNSIWSEGVAVTLTRAPLGATCPGDGACLSGFCTDGVCCDERCDEPCYACTAAKKGSGANGECGIVPAGSEDDGACARQAPETCGNVGVCAEGGRCETYPDGTVCGDGLACFDGTCQESWCDGEHTIFRSDGQLSCSPYQCSQATDVCLGSCASNLDCVEGFVCTAKGRCVSPEGDRYPSCSPACALAARRERAGRGWLVLILGGAILSARRRRRSA